MSDTKTTDKIRAGMMGDVKIPKWLIVSITGFVFGLLSLLIVGVQSASNKFAVMSDRQEMLRDDVQSLEDKLDKAASDRFTGTEGVKIEADVMAIREELSRREIRLREIERRLEALERP